MAERILFISGRLSLDLPRAVARSAYRIFERAIAKKVEKEKELTKNFEPPFSGGPTGTDFVNGTLCPLWLGRWFVVQTFEEKDDKNIEGDIIEIRKLLGKPD